jgi:exonuclease III
MGVQLVSQGPGTAKTPITEHKNQKIKQCITNHQQQQTTKVHPPATGEMGGGSLTFRRERQARTAANERATTTKIYNNTTVITQNVNGMHKATVASWMAAWKQRCETEVVDVVMVQETHVDSTAQATSLTLLWHQVWGLRNPSQDYAWWSVNDNKTGGVAFLINPMTQRDGRWHQLPDYCDRVAFLRLQNITYVTIYAPSGSNAERTRFYAALEQITPPEGMLVVMGDMNAVTNPSRDRSSTKLRTHVPENKTMMSWLASWQLTDALLQTVVTPKTDKELQCFRKDHMTCFRPGAQSRIDYCFITGKHREWAHSVHSLPPPGTI